MDDDYRDTLALDDADLPAGLVLDSPGVASSFAAQARASRRSMAAELPAEEAAVHVVDEEPGEES